MHPLVDAKSRLYNIIYSHISLFCIHKEESGESSRNMWMSLRNVVILDRRVGVGDQLTHVQEHFSSSLHYVPGRDLDMQTIL